MATTADRSAATEAHGSAELARRVLDPASLFDSAITFWSGTSGHNYVHTVYTLLGCPELPPSAVILVRRDGVGQRSVLKVMTVDHDAPSLNRANIRRTGAKLGADEVHVHFATGARHARHTAAFDINTRHGAMMIVGR